MSRTLIFTVLICFLLSGCEGRMPLSDSGTRATSTAPSEGLYYAEYQDGVAQITVEKSDASEYNLYYYQAELSEDDTLLVEGFTAEIEPGEDGVFPFKIKDEFGHAFENVEGALTQEDEELSLTITDIQNYGETPSVAIKENFVKCGTENENSVISKMPFHVLEASLFGQKFEDYFDNNLRNRLGGIKKMEVKIWDEESLLEYRYYNGVVIIVFQDWETAEPSFLKGYVITKPGIESVRGISVGSTAGDVLKAFPILYNQPNIDYDEDGGKISLLYGKNDSSQDRAYIEYDDEDEIKSVVYFNEETRLEFYIKEGSVAQIAFMR